LKTENRKLKIEKKFSLSKPATTTNKNIKKLFLFYFRVRADAAQRPQGRIVESAWMHSCPRGRECIRADALSCLRGCAHVRADAPCFTPGNFKKDATVRPSHGRPRGHRPIVRPSVRKRPRDNHDPACKECSGVQKFQSFYCGIRRTKVTRREVTTSSNTRTIRKPGGSSTKTLIRHSGLTHRIYILY
jgi:hypothetical protein